MLLSEDHKRCLARDARALQGQVRDRFRRAQSLRDQNMPVNGLWHDCIELSQIDCQVLALDPVTGAAMQPLAQQLGAVHTQFQVLTHQRTLPLCIRYIFLCLYVPYARLTAWNVDLADANLRRCAQGLLDLFVEVGNRMSLTCGDGGDAVYHKMLGITEQILEDETDHWDTLIAGFNHFKQYTKGLVQHVKVLQQRLRDAEHGRLQGDQAKRLSQQIIKAALHDQPTLPVSVVRLLQRFWVQVLAFTALDQGVGSEPFENQCDFVTGLVAHYSNDSKWVEVDDQSHYDQQFEQLMKHFERDIHRANISEFQLNCLRQELRVLHLRKLNAGGEIDCAGEAADRVSIETYQAEASAHSASQILMSDSLIDEASMMTWASLDQDRPGRQLDATSAESLAFVSGLNEGDWLMLWLGRLSHEPVQVLCYERAKARFIFIDHKGEHVCDKTSEDLVIAHQQGQLFKLKRFDQVDDVLQSQKIEVAEVGTRLQLICRKF